MQLALTADVLVPLGGAVAAVLLALLVVVIVRGRRRRRISRAESPVSRRVPTEPPAPAAPDRADEAGSGHTVAAAVAQALAARAAAARPDGPPPAVRDGDVRDRLLAVLLHDPHSAVGATVELERCRAQLDRLSDAVTHQRGELGEVMRRLAGTGLRPEHLARLSGMPVGEVRELLAGTCARAR